MDSAPSPRDELRELLAQLADGQIAAAGIARIDELVRGDLQLRRLYIEHMRLVADLEFAYGPERLKPPAAIPQLLANAKPTPTNQSSPAAEPVKSPVLGFLGGVVDYVNHSRRLMFLLVAVMLTGWFVVQVGSVLIGRWWAGDVRVADHPGATEPKRGEGAIGGPGQPHGTALAWLSGSTGSRWRIVAAKPAAPDFWEIGTEFTAGQQVNLVAGLGEITFRSGATVILSAPAQFSVTGAVQADLQVGKLTARVPHDSSPKGPSRPGATGFTINTPAGSVVDLGTEFGVEVTPDHKLNVQVFVGQVKVNSSPRGASDASSVEVSAGQSVHVEPGHPATVAESKDNQFHRDLKIESDSSDKQMAAYLDLMRKLKPVVWLRMEGKDSDRALHDEMGNAADGKLQWDGPGNPFVEGRVGKGLLLRGAQLKDYAVVADYPKAAHGKLSVSAWVRADSRPGYATIAANWREKVGGGQFHLGLFSNENEHSEDLGVKVTQNDGSTLNLHEGKGHPFPLYEWQHVAFTTNGSRLRLYRQGREVGSKKQAGLPASTPVRSLGIGVTFNDAGDAPGTEYPGWWDGRIDEIAVFNSVLSAEDIQKLAAAPPR